MYEGFETLYDSCGNIEFDKGPSNQDSYGEYERQYYNMEDEVRKFLTYFKFVINEGMIYEIQNLYENTWPKLTQQYFDKRPWPNEEEVCQVIAIETEEDKVFLILYKELYFRHLYARMQNSLIISQRMASFGNYCDFFNCLLLVDGPPVTLELPDLWLWELVDEFIYQFQSYSQFRARPKTLEEMNEMNSNVTVWNVLCVFNVLYSLVERSNIKQQLEVYAAGGDPNTVAGEYGKLTLYKMLGYFSLVGLLRLHSLLGDYYQAIKVLENIEIHKKYSHVPACQITTGYYVGFAYMMMRRYSDAIRTFSSILLYIQRTKQLFQSRTYQNDQINKQTEQMYLLMAICLVLHPQCIDESIQQVLKDKNYHEKMYKMQCGDLAEFESCFQMACPKFLPPVPAQFVSPNEEYGKEAMKYQTRVFMEEVQQQKMLPIIRSYLKLYTTLPLSKLAGFMCQGNNVGSIEKEITALRTYLLCFKHKMKNIVWTKGTSGLDGEFHSGSELDFYIDHDMIHIADTKVANRYGDFFIRKIIKFEELNRKLHSIKI